MKKRLFASLALMLCLPVYAQLVRKLPDLQVRTGANTGVLQPIVDAKPQVRRPPPNTRVSNPAAFNPNWLLIVVDLQVPGAQDYLDTLRQAGLSGEKAVVLVAGSAEQTRNWIAQQRWPNAAFISVDSAAALSKFKFSGVPMVLAVDARENIAWFAPGLPKKPGNLVLRMMDWVR
jgi:hypothetical protein